jgi:hypothetical protein
MPVLGGIPVLRKTWVSRVIIVVVVVVAAAAVDPLQFTTL